MSEGQTLKAAFIEFFRKILPAIDDPENLIKSRWQLFRKLLLDPEKTAVDIFEFAKKLSPASNTISTQSTHTSLQKPKSSFQLIEEEINSNTQSNSKKIDKSSNARRQNNVNFMTLPDLRSTGETKSLLSKILNSPSKTNKKQNDPEFPTNKVRISIGKQMSQLSTQMRKNTIMLDILDSRCFEVKNLGVEIPGLKEKKKKNEEMVTIVQNQREKSLKDYSIYACKTQQAKNIDDKLNNGKYTHKMVL